MAHRFAIDLQSIDVLLVLNR